MINGIDDERVAFYLRHQDLIETWASVRKDVADAAHGFYLSLAEDLAGLAPQLGDDVEVWVTKGSYSKVGLFRRDWFENDAPLVSASYEWHHDSTFVDGARIVGLRAHRATPAGRELRPLIGDAVRSVRDTRGFPRSSQQWPAYRYAAKPGAVEYWKDLTEYRSALVDEIVSVLESFSEDVQGALSVWRNSRTLT